MKKFKWIILTALVISAVGVLVACGTRNNNDNNTTITRIGGFEL